MVHSKSVSIVSIQFTYLFLILLTSDNCDIRLNEAPPRRHTHCFHLGDVGQFSVVNEGSRMLKTTYSEGTPSQLPKDREACKVRRKCDRITSVIACAFVFSLLLQTSANLLFNGTT